MSDMEQAADVAHRMGKHEVDKYFPRNGPCMSHSTRYARHRLLDVLRYQYHLHGYSIAYLVRNYGRSRAAIKVAVNSTPDDNRMTPKEIEEGKQMWRDFAKEMDAERKKKRRKRT